MGRRQSNWAKICRASQEEANSGDSQSAQWLNEAHAAPLLLIDDGSTKWARGLCRGTVSSVRALQRARCRAGCGGAVVTLFADGDTLIHNFWIERAK
jgi:hypothetical protein